MRSRTSIVQCADNPFSFYFSIQTEPYPCRQEGRRFERRPHFLANSRSLRQTSRLKWPTPRVLSALIMMALTRIYAPSLFLCLFILAHCLDPQHGDNMTDIDPSALACSHSLNDQYSTPRWPSAMLQLTCHRHPRRPYCRQQAPRPTFCAHLTVKRTSSLAGPFHKTLPFAAWLWPSGDLFSQTTLVRSFLRGTTVPPFFGRLQQRFDLRETSVTTFTFFSDNLFLWGPYSPLQI